MSPSAPGLRREQMALESADFSALAELKHRPLPLPSPRHSLSQAHLTPPVRFSPCPAPGRDGEQVGVGVPTTGVTGAGCQPHCAQGTASLLAQHLRKDPKCILGSRPTRGWWFPLPALETQPSRGSVLPEVLPVVGGCAGVGSGVTGAPQRLQDGCVGPGVFPLLGANCFGNRGCRSPFPEAGRGAEVKEM